MSWRSRSRAPTLKDDIDGAFATSRDARWRQSGAIGGCGNHEIRQVGRDLIVRLSSFTTVMSRRDSGHSKMRLHVALYDSRGGSEGCRCRQDAAPKVYGADKGAKWALGKSARSGARLALADRGRRAPRDAVERPRAGAYDRDLLELQPGGRLVHGALSHARRGTLWLRARAVAPPLPSGRSKRTRLCTSPPQHRSPSDRRAHTCP